MGHLLAYKKANAYHLARWNDTSSTNKTTMKHLGAGRVVLKLSSDAVRHFTFGSYVTKTAGSSTFPVAVGYTGAWTVDGERAVAASLYSAVDGATSSWPYMGGDWAQTNISEPVFWYASGGLGLSQESYIGSRSESCMGIMAKHFSLPAALQKRVDDGDVAEMSARVLVKGIGSWFEPNGRNSNTDYDATIGTIEGNPNYWGGTGSSAYTRRVQFATYQDSLSLGVHCFGGNLSKANFSPKQCFFVRSVCPDCGSERWLDLRRLCYSHSEGSESLSVDKLGTLYGVDMGDAHNAHWLGWWWHGTRSVETANTDRFAEQSWAAANGGAMTNQPIFTATGGTGWGPPYMPGAEWNPHDGSSRLFRDFQLTSGNLSDLADGGVWVVATALPMFDSKTYARNAVSSHFPGYAYLPAAEEGTEAGPCVNTVGTASNLQGKQMCTQVMSISDVGLELTIG